MTEHRPQKLYAYVDESGQHTQGRRFVVVVAAIRDNRELLEQILLEIEESTGKGNFKWSKTRAAKRSAYISRVLTNIQFQHTMYFAIYENARNYQELIIQCTAHAIKQSEPYERATIIVDGLSRTEQNRFASGIRALGVRTRKVRGADDEVDPFIRLADAICGFLGDLEEQPEYRKLLIQAHTTNILNNLGK